VSHSGGDEVTRGRNVEKSQSQIRIGIKRCVVLFGTQFIASLHERTKLTGRGQTGTNLVQVVASEERRGYS
jgi:hypothetical protein